MSSMIEQIKKNAAALGKTIVLCEGEDPRVVEAACKNHVGESRRPEYTVGLSGRLGYDMMFHLFFCKCTINFFSELSFV